MKYWNNLTLSLCIASLSVIFYIVGAIIFTFYIIKSEINSNPIIVLPIVLLVICLIMSIASAMLIFGIVKGRHLLILPWIIFTFVGIICDIAYLIAIVSIGQRDYIIAETLCYLIGIALQIFVFFHMYCLYKEIRFKYLNQKQHERVWRNHQQKFKENDSVTSISAVLE